MHCTYHGIVVCDGGVDRKKKSFITSNLLSTVCIYYHFCFVFHSVCQCLARWPVFTRGLRNCFSSTCCSREQMVT